MQGLAFIVGLLAIGYGYHMAGFLGSMTGLFTSVGVGSGLAVALAESGTGVAASGFKRTAQRIGGFIAAGACLTGAIWGGWTVGWLWGLGGYLAGVVSGVVFAFAMRIVHQEPWIAASEPSGQDPRSSGYFDLNNVAHVKLLDDIRTAYGALLADESHAYAGCMYRPEALLPYPKLLIRVALLTTLDFVEGRRDSTIVERDMLQLRSETILIVLECLDDFLDVPPEQLPTDPTENSVVGFELRYPTDASP